MGKLLLGSCLILVWSVTKEINWVSVRMLKIIVQKEQIQPVCFNTFKSANSGIEEESFRSSIFNFIDKTWAGFESLWTGRSANQHTLRLFSKSTSSKTFQTQQDTSPAYSTPLRNHPVQTHRCSTAEHDWFEIWTRWKKLKVWFVLPAVQARTTSSLL